ncbi:MAG: diphosphomevalonate decarboxylase [Verrucomicrobia bacterium]|nr:diphosphomevalonate decarboxylase [Verrucomicrobiota bacterium]
MNRKAQFVSAVLKKKGSQRAAGSAFAPVNIALVKYWGKRDQELNLPVTNSLSYTLSIGTHTSISLADRQDAIWLNDVPLSLEHPIARRLIAFCDLFRPDPATYFQIKTKNEVPTGAGLASSASGFAALTMAMNDLFGWDLDRRELSLLARLGSGSACRSLFDGFVEWHTGSREDGLDSFAERLDVEWPEFSVEPWILSSEQKAIDSRKAMQATIEHSSLYAAWPAKVAHDLSALKRALFDRDFDTLGAICENNALTMHATMIATAPPIIYWTEESLRAMRLVWQWRKNGLPIYFTMDAGPNLKLIFLKKDEATVRTLILSSKVYYPTSKCL